MENKVIRLIDLSFNFHPALNIPDEVIMMHRKGYGYIDFIGERLHITVIEHIAYEGQKSINGARYAFFKSNKRFWHIPFKTFRYIRREKPDVIISQGMAFPLQIMALRLYLGKPCAIIAQYHGRQPFTGVKKIMQRLADNCINAYIFASLGNAEEWIRNKIISSYDKCFEIPELSNWFQRLDKTAMMEKLGMTGHYNFLWVGRLDDNKDPMTLLRAFEKYLVVNSLAMLYMIFPAENLPADMEALIENNPVLKKAVCLRGSVPNEELPAWYSAADFYVSASQRESYGLALAEAMACGCIPIVTDIPSFRKITANGQCGLLYEPGNSAALLKWLTRLDTIDRDTLSAAAVRHFRENLSFRAIADGICNLSHHLTTRRTHSYALSTAQ